MVNTIALPSNAVAGNPMHLKHSVFLAKIVNRRPYRIETLVIDIGATNHIVCSKQLLTSYSKISHAMVELPNGKAVVVTHISTIQLSSHIA